MAKSPSDQGPSVRPPRQADGVFGRDQNVVQIHNNKDDELLRMDLVDVALEARRSIGESERRDLIFEVTVPCPEGRLPFIAFSNPHPVIGIRQVQLGELLGLG